MVWVCRGFGSRFVAAGCGDRGLLFSFFFVVLMVGEGGVLQIFSGGGWLVDSVVWVCGEWWIGGCWVLWSLVIFDSVDDPTQPE